MSPAVYDTDLWCPIGHFSEPQADKYAELCERVHPRFALEVGFCTGRSAACVLFYGGSTLERMISVDKDLDWQAPHGRIMAHTLKARFGIFDVMEGSSSDVLAAAFFDLAFPHGIDFATIDGDHSYEGCTADLEAIAPHVNQGGLLVVDDYRSGPPRGVTFDTVTRSVDDFLDRHTAIWLAETWHMDGKGLCIIRRVAKEPR